MNNENKIKQLQSLLNFIDKDYVASEDFVKYMQLVVEIFKKNRELSDEEIANLQNLTNDKIVALEDKFAEIESMIIERVSELKDGEPGKDATPPVAGVDYPSKEQFRMMLQELVNQIPTPKDGYTPQKGVDYFDGEPGKDGSPDTGKQIIEKINNDDTTLIKASKISGLQIFVDDAQKKSLEGRGVIGTGNVEIYKNSVRVGSGQGISFDGANVTVTHDGHSAHVSFADTGASIGGVISGGTTASVLFIGPGSTLAQDNANFYYTDSTNTLNVHTLSVAHDTTIGGGILVGHGALVVGEIIPDGQNGLDITLTDNGPDNFGTINIHANPEEGFAFQSTNGDSTNSAQYSQSPNYIAFTTYNGVSTTSIEMVSGDIIFHNANGNTAVKTDINMLDDGNGGMDIGSGTFIVDGGIGLITIAADITATNAILDNNGGQISTGALNVYNSGTTYVNLGAGVDQDIAVTFINDNSTAAQFIYDGGSGSGDFWAYGGGKMYLGPQPTPQLVTLTSTSVGIGNTSPSATAILELSSTTQGLLLPRMTTTQRNAISSPPAGLVIYNTTTNKINVRVASAWEAVTSA